MNSQHNRSFSCRFRRSWWRGSHWALWLALSLGALTLRAQTNWTIVGWNNLGMHCMDADFSVFCILPPYNVINAQVVNVPGRLVGGDGGVSVTYQAVADPSGSINTTSVGKGNFWEYVQPLFWLTLQPDMGLPIPGPNGFAMPGVNNTPQAMAYDTAADWFAAPGIPITPYDDAGNINRYPMMRLVARYGATVVAQKDIVLPVAEEMNCRACHGSDAGRAAQPADGWVNLADVEHDYRLNVLRLHDDRQLGTPVFMNALISGKYNPAGLYTTVVVDGNPILCASCHRSEALPGSGQAGIPSLTEAIHTQHAAAVDPVNGMLLDTEANRTSCYYCHPGQETRCLRGVMGSAVAPSGQLSMECQSCHGGMSAVGSPTRTGWLDEPNCQACHTGDALNNSGLIRYTSVFDSGTHMRVAANQRFATTPNTPDAGHSLYRFSRGHGGLYCQACHGSTHAEFPTTDVNDNIFSLQHQGYVGPLAECQSCHGTQPSTVSGGPHGLHPMGQTWVSRHKDNSGASCRTCHGADYRGTVLSRARGNRTLSAFGTKTFWRGFQIGCYNCHNGPNSESQNSNRPAAVTSRAVTVAAGASAAIPLQVSDPDGNALTLRVVTQPPHGRVGLSGTVATYFPDPGFSGQEVFTFAAWDGSTDSNLGTVTVTVGTGPICTYAITPASATVGTLAGSGTVTVNTTAGCSWSVVNSVPWVSIASGASGTGPGQVSYRYTASTSSASRSGTLTIAGQPFTLTQAGTVCVYSLTPTGASVSAGTGSGTVTVSAGPGCAWTANSSASWLTLTGATSGSGPGTVTYAVAANPLTASRTGTLTIAGLIYAVNQAGSSCTYALSPASASVGSGAGGGSVAVTTTAGCPWTANSNASWLTITGGTSGTGAGTVAYTVAANTGTTSRSGTLTIAGRSFIVTQSGVACAYAIDPTSASLTAGPTNGMIAVATGPSCIWTASSAVPWITLTSGASGIGNGTVRYSVAANTATLVRNGSLTVAGVTFVVTQAGSGSGCTYLLTPTSARVSSRSNTYSFRVTTGGGCRWTARSNVSWVTISSGASGTGTGTVRYRVSRNSSRRPRTGTITAGGLTFTVYQSGSSSSGDERGQIGAFGEVSIAGVPGRERITAEFVLNNDSEVPLERLHPAVYLSDNAERDASDVLLWGRAVESVAPGESAVGKFRLTLPAGVSAKGKYLVADVSGGGRLKAERSPTAVFGPLP
jgi:hypothetical protein